MDADNTQQIPDVPNHSEAFGNLPNVSESFGSVPHLPERNENHILTVRQVARMFEEVGVPRSERSITNWCHGDPMRPSRLDAGFDPNERKFFITPQSVERVIAEEKAKLQVETMQNVSEGFGNVRKASEEIPRSFPNLSEAPPKHERPATIGEGIPETETPEDAQALRALKAKIRRMSIEAEVNKRYIEKLEQERAKDVDRMIEQGRMIGTLENQVKQLDAPKPQPRQTSETYPPHVRQAEIITDPLPSRE